MKAISKIISLCALSLLLFTSCEKEENNSAQAPVIESASIVPDTFTFGDTLTITAKVSDAVKRLSALEIQTIVNERTIASQRIILDGSSADVSEKIFVPLVDNTPDNATVKFLLKLTNNKNVATTGELTGFTGKRPHFTQLYLVVENGGIYPLAPQTANKDIYETSGVVISRAFTCRIAQKITADNRIDYSGLVWGNVDGKIQLTDETSSGIFAFATGMDYTSSFVFDNYSFKTSVTGSPYATPNLMLDNFDGTVTIDGEEFYKLAIALTKNQELAVYNELASTTVVFNVDFFDRVNANKIKFLGETGNYTLYYNPVRKNVIAGVASPVYPQYLLACGYGLGYPVKITPEQLAATYSGKHITTTSWGFDNILQYVLFREISSNVYQATVFMPGEHDHYAGFGIYENSGWANQKNASEYAFSGVSLFATGGSNFEIPNGASDPVIASDNYRITLNTAAKTVNITKIILP